MPVCHDWDSIQYFDRDRFKTGKICRIQPHLDIMKFFLGNIELRRLKIFQCQLLYGHGRCTYVRLIFRFKSRQRLFNIDPIDISQFAVHRVYFTSLQYASKGLYRFI